MKRRQLLGLLAYTLLVLLVGCKEAPERTGAGIQPTPGPTSSPSPGVTSQPTASPSPSSDGTPNTGPSAPPSSAQPIVVDRAQMRAVSVESVAPEAPDFLEDAYAFRVQSLDGKPVPSSLTIQANAKSESLRVFLSNAQDEERHQYWTEVGSKTARESDRVVSVTIDAQGEGRYLTAGKQKTVDTSSLEFFAPSSVTQAVDVLPAFGGDASLQAQSLFTAQYIDASPDSRNKSPLPAHKVLKGEKTLLLAIHGAGEQVNESEQYGWRDFFDWVAQSSFADEFKKRFVVALHKWDTTQPFDAKLPELYDALVQKYGERHIVILAHSMGGLRARAFYAWLFEKGVCAGIVTLGTPHLGSPLASPKLMRSSFARQPDPTRLLILYQLGLSNAHGLIRSLTLGRKLVSQWFLDPVGFQHFSNGLRSLASYGDIPTEEFVTTLAAGVQAHIPFRESITPSDALVLAASACALYADSSVKLAVETRTDNGTVRLNAIKALEAFERNKGRGHIVAYGAYCASDVSAQAAHVLASEGKTVSGLARIAADLSKNAKQAMLHWIANQIFPIIRTASGRQYRFSDGLVPLESALALSDGSPIDGTSIDGHPQHDGAAVEKRRSPAIAAVRVLRGKTHLDLLIDQGHFLQVARDLIDLDNAQKATLPAALSPADRAAIKDMLREDFQGSDSRTFEYAGGTHSWSISVTLYPENILVAPKGGGAAAATFSTFVSNYTQTIGGQWYDWSGDNYRGYQTYRVRLRKVGNVWRYTQGYETLSFESALPNPYPQP